MVLEDLRRLGQPGADLLLPGRLGHRLLVVGQDHHRDGHAAGRSGRRPRARAGAAGRRAAGPRSSAGAGCPAPRGPATPPAPGACPGGEAVTVLAASACRRGWPSDSKVIAQRAGRRNRHQVAVGQRVAPLLAVGLADGELDVLGGPVVQQHHARRGPQAVSPASSRTADPHQSGTCRGSMIFLYVYEAVPTSFPYAVRGQTRSRRLRLPFPRRPTAFPAMRGSAWRPLRGPSRAGPRLACPGRGASPQFPRRNPRERGMSSYRGGRGCQDRGNEDVGPWEAASSGRWEQDSIMRDAERGRHAGSPPGGARCCRLGLS